MPSNLLQLFFNNSTTAAIFLNASGQIIQANHAAHKLFGYEEGELIGMINTGFFVSEQERLLFNDNRIKFGKANAQLKLKKKNGDIFEVLVASENIKDENEDGFTYTTFMDIEDSNPDVAGIIEKSILLKKLIDSTSDIIVIIDKHYKKKYINAAAFAILGYHPDELKEASIGNFVYEEDKEKLMSMFYNLQTLKQVNNFEFRLVHKNGTLIDMSWTYRYDDETGDIYSLGRDIRENMKNRNIQQKNEANLLSIFANSPIGITVLRKDGYLIPNNTFCRMLGYTQEELMEERDTVYNLPEDINHRAQTLKMFEEGKVTKMNYEMQFVHKSGKIIYADMSRILNPNYDATDAHSPYIITNIIDITDKKEAEQKLVQLNERLMASNADLERFAYVASHDLQSPLRLVKGFMEMLETKYGDELDEKAKEYIRIAVSSAEKMSTLVRELLTYSKIGNTAPLIEEVDLNVVVQDMVFLYQNKIKSTDAKIIITPLPTIKASKVFITQLMQNLMGNALKYRNKNTNPIVEITAQETEKEWTISIKDNGIGIDPKNAEKIFVVFERLQTQEAYSGTGIGLATCKKIVERLNGSIWVNSQLGMGATFSFSLPK